MPKVGFHGVRGSCPCSDPAMARYGGSTASVVVEPDDASVPVLLDLGTGCRSLGFSLLDRYFPGASRPSDVQPRDEHDPASTAEHDNAKLHLSAFVTHLHFDHVQGLPFFGPALRSDVRLDVYGPIQDGTLSEAFSRFVKPPYFPVEVGELPGEVGFFELADGEQVKVGPSIVIAREVPHVGRTLGYRIEVDGVVIAYLSDHQAPSADGRVIMDVSEAVLDLCRDADLLIHDAQYTDDEFLAKWSWGHSTIAYAVEVARKAGARQLALFHHDPTHDDEQLDALAKQASQLAGSDLSVLMAAEDLVIDVFPASSVVLIPARQA
jgi:phosphoribosyl 1,2-cyclic phosphodiesterase